MLLMKMGNDADAVGNSLEVLPMMELRFPYDLAVPFLDICQNKLQHMPAQKLVYKCLQKHYP